MTKEQTPQDANEATIGAVALDRRVSHLCENPWLEAAVAWEVCASIHERYAKGKDALYSTRRRDFLKHAEDARKMANAKVTGFAPPPKANREKKVEQPRCKNED